MKQLAHIITGIVFLVFAPGTTSFAQSKYYVATTGNDANAGTSLAAPFATIAKAVLVAIVPGDTIFVRTGTYTVTSTVKITKPGTAARHIVLTVYKPDLVDANSRPVFDFSSMAAGSSNRGFTLTGANYWDIYGIVIKGAGDNGMNVSGTGYTTIEFCSFTRSRDSGLQLGGGTHHVTVKNCDSFENADRGAGTTSNGGNADGFAPKLDIGDSIRFIGCRAWMNSDDAWDGYMRTPIGTDNQTTFLEDCWAFRNGYYWLDGSTTSDQNGNGFKMGGSDNKDLAHNFVLVKCLAFMNKAKGFDQNSNAGSIYLYNCTGYKNGANDFGLTSSTAIYQPGAQLVLKNNLSLGSKGVSIPSSSTATRAYTAATNSFSTATTSTEILSFDTTGISGMRSVDGSLPTLNFMRLNTSAPGPYNYINKGTVVTDVLYHGAMGVPFTGSAPDLGTFESAAGTLPVKLVSFTALQNSAGVLLSWKIASELNNKGWKVESATGENNTAFKEIGFVYGNNSPVQASYSFLDKNTTPGIYYYRLQQIDIDGTATYSQVIVVKIGSKSAGTIEVYPNPAQSVATISYGLQSQTSVCMSMYNSEGKLVSTMINEVQAMGTHQQVVDVRTLRAGTYYIKLTAGKEAISSVLVKE